MLKQTSRVQGCYMNQWIIIFSQYSIHSKMKQPSDQWICLMLRLVQIPKKHDKCSDQTGQTGLKRWWWSFDSQLHLKRTARIMSRLSKHFKAQSPTPSWRGRWTSDARLPSARSLGCSWDGVVLIHVPPSCLHQTSSHEIPRSRFILDVDTCGYIYNFYITFMFSKLYIDCFSIVIIGGTLGLEDSQDS